MNKLHCGSKETTEEFIQNNILPVKDTMIYMANWYELPQNSLKVQID